MASPASTQTNVQVSQTTAPAAPPRPAQEMEAEIANTFDLETKLKATANDLQAKREKDEVLAVGALARELAIASIPLNLDGSTLYKQWKAADDALVAKARAIDDALGLVQRHIDRLKKKEPEAVRSLLEGRLEDLQQEVARVNEQLKQLTHPSKHAK
jgi:hypothetical protein